MSEYRIRPHWPRRLVSGYLGVLLVMCCGAVAGQKRQVDVVASIPAILLGCYVVVALWRNKVEVTAGPNGIRVWFGPMILGERERWIGREEIAEVCVRDFTTHGKNGGRFRTAGVVLRDGDTFDLYVSCPPHPETEGEAMKIAAALGVAGAISHSDKAGKRRLRRAKALVYLRGFAAVAVCLAWAIWWER
jgi:hypothetical protein